MARSRRRILSRQSISTSRLPYATWAKWALVALGVGGGTYGVHRLVNSIPAGAIADSSGTEVGPHLAEAASTQKPPLPDDTGGEGGPGTTLPPIRVANHTNPADTDANSTALTALPPSIRPAGTVTSGGNSASGTANSAEDRLTPTRDGVSAGPGATGLDRSLANSLSAAASSGSQPGMAADPPARGAAPPPALLPASPTPSASPEAGLLPTGAAGQTPSGLLAGTPLPPGGSPSGTGASDTGMRPAPLTGLPNPGLPNNPANPLGSPLPRSASGEGNGLRTPSRLPGSELPGAGQPDSPAMAATAGSTDSNNPAEALPPRPISPVGSPLTEDSLRSLPQPAERNASPSGLSAAGSLAENPNIPRLNSIPSPSPPAAPLPRNASGLGPASSAGSPSTSPPGNTMINPTASGSPAGMVAVPTPADASGNAALNPGLPVNSPPTPLGGGLASAPANRTLATPGSAGSMGAPVSPLGPPPGATPTSLPSTGPAIGIPSASRPPAINPGQNSSSSPTPTVSNSPPPIGREPNVPAGAGSFNPGSRLSATLVSNRPGDPQWEIQQQAALVIEKLAPPTVQVNVPAKFLMVVRNVGRVPAGQVLIRDRVPEKARLIQANPKPTRQDGDLMEWELAALAPGEAYQIQLDLLPTEPGEIGSVAQVTSSAVAATRTRSTRPQLNIEHAAPAQVMVGQTVVMNIVVRNDGDGVAENVIIREVVPPQLMHPSGNEIENPLGNLAPGQTRTLQLPLVARTPGTARNTIRVSGDGKLSAEHSIDIQIVAPQLQVLGDGPERRFLSRPATHTFQVKNQGSANATNVQMMARLPQGLRYDSSSPAGRYDPSRHAVFWAMANLPSNAEQSVTLTTMPMAPGEQPIEFHALADLNQPQVTTQTLLVEQLSELFFDIDDLQDPIEVGTNTIYVIRVENQGSQVANNVAMVIDFPAGVEPLNVESPIEYQLQRDGQASRLVFAPVANMNPRAQMVIRVEARGSREGDHPIEVRMTSAQRPAPVAKQESTKVYADR